MYALSYSKNMLQELLIITELKEAETVEERGGLGSTRSLHAVKLSAWLEVV